MRRSLPARAVDAVVLTVVFLRELLKSSVAVARAAFARHPRTASAILAVPIDLRTDFGIAVLANLVTLTPGTCSLHVSDDRRTLYVHSLDADNPAAIVADIRRTFEDRIRRIEG
ncbi:Na+/H+ antiporter subunit E [Aureimonas sp. SK2]|uniref:Na+/H+ antiporter subunit E n=1 Tax=Aureimonas sp. SK2 TaxID=3015992 RepID=UPI0024449E26|nr:Na+/H+ antiporter subunit E [Aureimonas sp. SK2]